MTGREVGLEERRPGQDGLEVALVAGDGGARGLSPDADVGAVGLPTLGSQRVRHVHEGVGVESQVAQAGRPFSGGRRGFVERGGQGCAGLGEIAEGDGLGPPVVGEPARGFRGEEHRVP